MNVDEVFQSFGFQVVSVDETWNGLPPAIMRVCAESHDDKIHFDNEALSARLAENGYTCINMQCTRTVSREPTYIIGERRPTYYLTGPVTTSLEVELTFNDNASFVATEKPKPVENNDFDLKGAL